MGETFAIQVPYNAVMITPDLVRQVNYRIAANGHKLQFDNLYAVAQNVETGAYFVEGKVKTGTGAIDIDDLEIPMELEGVEFKGTVTHPRRIRLYSIGQCVDHVLGWSKARGILANGVWYTQATKLYEEDGEAATGVNKTKQHLIMDGIGDAMVVLVNFMELIDAGAVNIPSLIEYAKKDIVIAGNSHRLFHKMRKHITDAVDAVWEEAGVDSPARVRFEKFDFPTKKQVDFNIVGMLAHAMALANAYDMTLEQCFSLAWDEIKDRKGFLNADGIFVKEADMTPEQKAAQSSL